MLRTKYKCPPPPKSGPLFSLLTPPPPRCYVEGVRSKGSKTWAVVEYMGKFMKDKIKENKNENSEVAVIETKKRKTLEEDQFRVVISKESNEVLEKLVVRVNDGFEGGEVNKSDIANVIFLNAAKTFSESEIKVLRNLHFDERKVLRALLRKSEDLSDLPEEIKKSLREYYGLSEQNKKRSSKNQTELSTEKNVDNHSGAQI